MVVILKVIQTVFPRERASPEGAIDVNNRRSDHAIRSAIDAIQSLLFDPLASTKIFDVLLNHIQDITDSDYSACFLADPQGINPIDACEIELLHPIYGAKSIAFVHNKVLMHWVKQKILPMRPTFFNAPIPNSYASLLIAPDKINAIMILPLINQGRLRAVCMLGKQHGDYSAETVRRLMPLFGSVICALQSADRVKGSILSFDQKISDHRYLNTLLSSSPIAIIVVSPDSKILLANPVANKMFCNDSITKELAGSFIKTLLPDYKSLFQWSNQHNRYGSDCPILGPQVWEDQKACRIDGSTFIVNLTVFRYTHANKSYTTLQIQDITTMRENADEYHQASQQLSALTHLVPVGIIRVDSHWQCVYANDKWYEFSGLTEAESGGPHWINAIHSDDIKILLEELRDALQLGNDYRKEIRLVSPLGQIRWVDFNTRVLFDESGAVIGFLGTFQDVTERLLHQEKLRHVAEYDSLTGLTNRNLFQDRLEQAFYASERDKAKISVFFLDLDGFKDVNDTLGHDVGDLLLQEVAQRLLNTLRRNDTVARFGGDEFVILLGLNEKANVIEKVASKVIDAIAKPYMLNDQEVFVTVSIGIANGTYTNSSPKQILKQADAALYIAKREGKNNFQLFSANINQESQKRVMLANQLRNAVSNSRYHLLYQPIADIKTRRVLGFEALLRFTDEQDTLVNPSQFIPILEETGMVVEVGRWVIDEACKQLSLWQQDNKFPKDGFLAFNVSPKQLLDESIVTVIQASCNKYQVDPNNLIMEITETVIISKPQKVEKILAELKRAGIRLAMDDFGTGYSSLSYLQKYPFDYIKIDRTFVEDLLTKENDANITKAIIMLAQSLGLKVTAEGVTDQDTLSYLEKCGANHFQGYFLGHPEHADKAVEELSH